MPVHSTFFTVCHFFVKCVEIFLLIIVYQHSFSILTIAYKIDQQSIQIIINKRIHVHAILGKVTHHENCTALGIN